MAEAATPSIDGDFVLDPSTLDEVAAKWEPLDSLVPFEGNPKIHTESAPEVATSVIRFGWGAPVLARRDGRMIVGGHGRRLAALIVIERWAKATTREKRTWNPDAVRVAQRREVPTRLLDLDDNDSRLLLIADNMIGERLSQTDEEKLEALARRLAADGADLLGGTGLDDSWVKKALAVEGLDGAAPTPAPPSPTTTRTPTASSARCTCSGRTA